MTVNSSLKATFIKMKLREAKIKNFRLSKFRISQVIILSLSVSLGSSAKIACLKSNDSNELEQLQIRSHSAAKNEITQPERVCVRCRKFTPESKFASKGRQRKSKLCKSCDNQRRRSTYENKSTEPNWNDIAVSFESVAAVQMNSLATSIFELLQDQHLIGLPTKQEEIDVSKLIKKQSVIDLID